MAKTLAADRKATQYSPKPVSLANVVNIANYGSQKADDTSSSDWEDNDHSVEDEHFGAGNDHMLSAAEEE